LAFPNPDIEQSWECCSFPEQPFAAGAERVRHPSRDRADRACRADRAWRVLRAGELAANHYRPANARGEKVIHLHAFAPLWGLVDISPFVTKVDVYLRLTKLPYKLVPFSMESFTAAPKGKLPYIVDGEERIADSNFFIDHLKKRYGDPLDAKHDPTDGYTLYLTFSGDATCCCSAKRRSARLEPISRCFASSAI
jgi:hypothetical protein